MWGGYITPHKTREQSLKIKHTSDAWLEAGWVQPTYLTSHFLFGPHCPSAVVVLCGGPQALLMVDTQHAHHA